MIFHFEAFQFQSDWDILKMNLEILYTEFTGTWAVRWLIIEFLAKKKIKSNFEPLQIKHKPGTFTIISPQEKALTSFATELNISESVPFS